MSSSRPCLIDTNVFIWIRDHDLDPFEYVGSADLAISDTIATELQGPLPADHPIVLANWALARRMGGQVVDDTDVEAGRLGEEIAARYKRHDPPSDDPADALIAAAAIRSGRVLITRNWKDFHYVTGLEFVDARVPASQDLLVNVGVQRGSLDSPCCRGARRP